MPSVSDERNNRICLLTRRKRRSGVTKIARDVGLSKFSVSRITGDPDKALESLSRWAK